jgi:hypothetical protein
LMKKILLILFLLLDYASNYAQYAPIVGSSGCQAVYKDSSIFVSWAVSCNVSRGLKNILLPDSGYVSAGVESSAVGKAGENGIISLGDGGNAILTFEKPIVNGEGWDFAVFENSFDDYFLELAFVEVSSDGVNYFRFPSVSLTQDTLQINTFGILDAEKINNLAGKYRGMYGTPFDLEELKLQSGLDVNNITHVKIIDAIGCINDNYATFDSQGNKVNDPWPTCFPIGGFDLDAVGVIHQKSNASSDIPVLIYPNPFTDKINIDLYSNIQGTITLKIVDLTGRTIKVFSSYISECQSFDLSDIKSGIYLAVIYNVDNEVFIRKIVKP